jgi:hypothetical protein
MLLPLLYLMLLGLDRIETTQLLGQNGVFQYLTGLPSYPTPRRCAAFCFVSRQLLFRSCALWTTAISVS